MSRPADQLTEPPLLELTTEIVAAHVRGNAVAADALPELIRSVHAALANTGAPPTEQTERREPAVPIKRSIHREYLICLEDGAKVKMLRRYLRRFNLTPADYRARWKLPADYPLVAPAYAEHRSSLAKERGLGRKRAVELPAADETPALKAPARKLPAKAVSRRRTPGAARPAAAE